MEKNGTILSVTGGLYEILCGDGELLRCKARGAFRHDGQKPLVGDEVTVRTGDKESEGLLLSSLLPRRNRLMRPPLANVGVLFIVLAAARPAPILLTVDKLTVIADSLGIEPVIVLTKADLDPEKAEELASLYRKAGFAVHKTSASEESPEGIEPLRAFLLSMTEGKIAAFCGASGVGKSTLLSTVFPSLSLETGELSRKVERGKQTTRVTRLFPLSSLAGEGHTGFIADTPGFSMLDFSDNEALTKEDLVFAFREFAPLNGKCRWMDCRHHKEDGCAILEAVARGEIPPSRHESYLRLWDELKARQKW